MEKNEAYKIAEKRLALKMSFLIHLAIYVVVNVFLIYINLETSADYLWFKWPLLGWGAGLMFHGLGVFFFAGVSDLRRRMLDQEAEKLMAAGKEAD